jgi:hypothetical protein
MNSLFRKPLSCLCLLLTMPTVVRAQKVKHPPPPQPPSPEVISRVTSAKKIFLSNTGADNYFVNDIPGGADVSYTEFYASLKQWGHFQLVDSPAQADLIFDIRGTETCDWNQKGNITSDHYVQVCSAPKLNLSILDPSQHLLFKIVLLAGRAGNIPKGKIAFAKSIDALTAQIKALVAPDKVGIPE